MKRLRALPLLLLLLASAALAQVPTPTPNAGPFTPFNNLNTKGESRAGWFNGPLFGSLFGTVNSDYVTIWGDGGGTSAVTLSSQSNSVVDVLQMGKSGVGPTFREKHFTSSWCNTTADCVGAALVINPGRSSGTNQNGATLVLAGAPSTGLGYSQINFMASPSGPSGSAYNTLATIAVANQYGWQFYVPPLPSGNAATDLGASGFAFNNLWLANNVNAGGVLKVGSTLTPLTDAAGKVLAARVNDLGESQVTGLVSDLAAKAADGAVMHLAGDEASTGTKTFNAGATFRGPLSLGAMTYAAGATPTLSGGAFGWIYNGAATDMTGLVGSGVDGQLAVLQFGDAVTTLKQYPTGNFLLKGGADYTPPANSTVTFIYTTATAHWYEVSRSG